MGKRIRTDFLVATPSFVSGVARLLDFYGQFDSYNATESEAEADCQAILSDWDNVGHDMSAAINEYELANA